jgi:hypothetical protein
MARSKRKALKTPSAHNNCLIAEIESTISRLALRTTGIRVNQTGEESESAMRKVKSRFQRM